MKIDDRLRAVSSEIAGLMTEIGILDEQITFQTDVSEDARLRAIVSETPLADRDSTEAHGDLTRLQRSREDAQARLEALRAEQDRLLEKRIEQSR